jgi:hypothetical protein
MVAVCTTGVRCCDAAESSQVTSSQSHSHITATTAGKSYSFLTQVNSYISISCCRASWTVLLTVTVYIKSICTAALCTVRCCSLLLTFVLYILHLYNYICMHIVSTVMYDQAQFCPDAFARVHLEGTLDHLVQACSKLDQRGAAFLALGQVSQLCVNSIAKVLQLCVDACNQCMLSCTHCQMSDTTASTLYTTL